MWYVVGFVTALTIKRWIRWQVYGSTNPLVRASSGLANDAKRTPQLSFTGREMHLPAERTIDSTHYIGGTSTKLVATFSPLAVRSGSGTGLGALTRERGPSRELISRSHSARSNSIAGNSVIKTKNDATSKH